MVSFFFFFFWYYLAKCNKSHQYVVLMLSLPPFYSETPSWMPVGADFQVTACDSYIKNFITAKHLSFSTSDFSFLVHYPLNKFTYFKLFFFFVIPIPWIQGIINASWHSEISVLIQPEVNFIYFLCSKKTGPPHSHSKNQVNGGSTNLVVSPPITLAFEVSLA